MGAVIAHKNVSFVQWANDMAAKVRPVIDNIIAVIQGRDVDVKNDWILRWRDNIVSAFNWVCAPKTALMAH